MLGKDARKILAFSFASTALCAASVGIYTALHSPLFLVQVVETPDLPENAPIDARSLVQLTAIQPGIVNLFDLNLKTIENRVRTNTWVREVRLQKRFPQTLSLNVTFREPRALLQFPDGSLSYVDRDGAVFGSLNLKVKSDLPTLTGITADEPPLERGRRIHEVLRVIDAWDQALFARKASAGAQLASLGWDAERGYRALITYPLRSPAKVQRGRAMVDLGQKIDDRLPTQIDRLFRVIEYLGKNSIASHQIWADSAKKIVVKTARGS